MNTIDKVVAKWFILKVQDIRDHGGFSSLSTIKGAIKSSNFIIPTENYEIPASSKSIQQLDLEDIVRFTFYTHQSKVKDMASGTIAFADVGLRYEKFTSDGWELIYEDFYEPLDNF